MELSRVGSIQIIGGLSICNQGELVSQSTPDFASLSADVVSAYVSNNSVPREDLAALIATVDCALVGAAQSTPEPVVGKWELPISIKKSVKPDFIISMESGNPYNSMKRHLTARGLTLRNDVRRS